VVLEVRRDARPAGVLVTTAFYRVSEHGSFLATRSAGKAVRESLEHEAGPRAAIVIDFTDVAAMTFGFADEFLGKFYDALAAGFVAVPAVLLRGLNEEALEATQVCLGRRELVAACVDGDEIHLIAAPEYLDETYRHAVALHRFRAAELSERLGITTQNMNNRLKRLVCSGALTRENVAPSTRGGREYLYTIPAARPAAPPRPEPVPFADA